MKANIMPSGTWTGHYCYGRLYGERHGKKVSFQMELRVDEETFSGTCLDDTEKVPFTEPAAIQGSITMPFVSFIKKYPFLWQLDEEGRDIFDEAEGAHEIHYLGRLSGNEIRGSFELGEHRVFALSEQVVTGGTFIMKYQPGIHDGPGKGKISGFLKKISSQIIKLFRSSPIKSASTTNKNEPV